MFGYIALLLFIIGIVVVFVCDEMWGIVFLVGGIGLAIYAIKNNNGKIELPQVPEFGK